LVGFSDCEFFEDPDKEVPRWCAGNFLQWLEPLVTNSQPSDPDAENKILSDINSENGN
jgi:hypothetical protein